jgi:RHS repeat-associated protein
VTRADGSVFSYSPATSGGFPASGASSFAAPASPISVPVGQVAATFYETDPNGHTTSTALDGDGDPIEIIDALGQITTMAYDDQRNKIALTLPNGSQYNYTYDLLGNCLTTLALADSALTSYTYTPTFNLVQTKTDPLGRIITNSYDGSGNLTQILDPAGGTMTMTYNGAGQVTSVKDQRGNTSTLTYDSYGRVATFADPLGHQTTSGYDNAGNHDNAGNLISSIDPRGNTTAFQYDAGNKVTSMTAADGGVTRYAYDNDKDLIKVTDPRGNSSSWTFDSRQRPISHTDGAGLTTKNAYDGVDNLTSFTDAGGGVWNYSYDAINRRQSVTDLFGNVTQWTYDPVGNVTATVRPDGSTFASDFDPLSRLVETVAPDGSTTSYTYDVADQRTKVQDALHGVVSFAYDALGRRISATDQLNRTTKWSFDPASNLIQITYPDSTSTTFSYDAASRRTQATYADGGVVAYSYDQNGNLVALTDANSATRQFSYDSVNRPAGDTDPLGYSRVKTYDLAGNLVSLTRRDGAVVSYSYDADNRLIKKTLPAIGSVPGDQVSFSYDALSDIISAGNSSSAISNQFDAMAHLVQTGQTLGGNTQTLSFTYDRLWRRIQMTDIVGSSTYGYDSRDRLTSLVDASGSAFSFTFDPLSRMTAAAYPNGLTASLSYDAASQLTSIVHAAGSTIANANYAYNSLGNRTSETREDGNTRSFSYDPVSRVASANSTLAAVPNEAFNYDKAGNPTNNAQLYDAADELLGDANYSYSYDREGNMTVRQNKTNPSDRTTFGYDAENRLVQVSVGPNGAPTAVVTYTYDPFGRRIAKTSNGTLTRYVLDGLDVRLELNGANQVTASNVHASGIESLLERIGGSGATYIHSDGLGSTIALTNGTGGATERYRYSSFGNLSVLNPDFSQKSANSPLQPFTYTGREWEPESGLYFNRARYLSPANGRWLNADPAGLAGGLNLYAYVGNNPINAIDPLGLAGLTTAQQLAQAQSILAQNTAIIQRSSGGGLSNSDIASIGGGAAGLGIAAANAYHYAQPASTDLRYYGMTMARSDVTAQALDVVGNGLAVTGAAIDGYALGNSIVKRDANGIETSSANIATDLTAAALGGPAGIFLGGSQLAISVYVTRDQLQFDAYNREADLQQAIYLSQLAQAAIMRLQKQSGNCP